MPVVIYMPRSGFSNDCNDDDKLLIIIRMHNDISRSNCDYNITYEV